MVFVFEYDDDGDDPANIVRPDPLDVRHYHSFRNDHISAPLENLSVVESNLNINSFSAVLVCYPVVSSLAQYLDLNSLHNLSRTCRQFRGTLLMYRDQLVSRTLRCINEDQNQDSGSALAKAFVDSRSTWQTTPSENESSRRLTSGKIGKCARDMVADCRRCGTIVCRNCTAKPPPTPQLADRHRRLCRACLKAPLKSLLAPPSNSHSNPSSPSTSLHHTHSSPHLTNPPNTSHPSSIHPTFLRDPCNCPENTYLCLPCGRTLRPLDATYLRTWRWRQQYSGYTGLSEGIKGVECGRKASCVSARLVEQEVDVDADTAAEMAEEAERTGGRWQGGSFGAQEVEGIGGKVQMKVKRLVTVGQEVDEGGYEEGEGESVLGPEKMGEQRSWCSWCARVVLGRADRWGGV
ncbi:hypothetical protein BT63DRAFT_413680 [Microthyrium microscopicum]|uniref:F-box domain-containing protein n=1 Tax=Microthyrium microscopicum TaxID=703497 RepID=A0A6A6UAE5_9PEZI|nr:hypothetical protein BT63DRAFT_413680 [Microthyrium microscopicum]